MEKFEPAVYSKANTINSKGKKKYDVMKNYLGPKEKHNKFKNYGGLKRPKSCCYVCEKTGHYARDCRHNKSKSETNVIHVDDYIIDMVREIMTIKGKVQWWLYDTCATVHVLYDKVAFKIYFVVTDGQEVQMEKKDNQGSLEWEPWKSTSLQEINLLLSMYFMFPTRIGSLLMEIFWENWALNLYTNQTN